MKEVEGSVPSESHVIVVESPEDAFTAFDADEPAVAVTVDATTVVTRVPGDCEAYNVLIQSYADGGRVELADNVLADMAVDGVTPNATTFLVLYDAHLVSTDPHAVFEAKSRIEHVRRWSVLLLC